MDRLASVILPQQLHRHRDHEVLPTNSSFRAAGIYSGCDSPRILNLPSEVAGRPSVRLPGVRSAAGELWAWAMVLARPFESLAPQERAPESAPTGTSRLERTRIRVRPARCLITMTPARVVPAATRLPSAPEISPSAHFRAPYACRDRASILVCLASRAPWTRKCASAPYPSGFWLLAGSGMASAARNRPISAQSRWRARIWSWR